MAAFILFFWSLYSVVVMQIGSWLIIINRLMEIPCVNKVIVSCRIVSYCSSKLGRWVRAILGLW